MARISLAVAALLALSIVPGTAPVAGHTLNGVTQVSRSRLPVGPIEPGRRVIVFGSVKGTDPSCWAGQPVELVRVDPDGAHVVVARDSVEGTGRYWFIRRPRKPLQLYVRYPGIEAITAEHSHVCTAGASKPVNLRVKK